MRKEFAAFVFFVAALTGGCGYSTSAALPSSWRTINVPPFQNKINFTTEKQRNLYQPLLEVKVRDAIVKRFQFDGHLRIADEDAADLILSGELVDYNRGVLRYTDNNDPEEYRVQISVNLKLTEGKDGPIVWEENGFTGEGDYFVTGPNTGTEAAAIQEALTDLARRTVERTIENW